jgi:hypothetical protein
MRDTQEKTRSKWRSFKEARAFARSLRMKSRGEWYAWSKAGARPVDISAYPDSVYRDKGWISWGDWLGTGTIWVGNRHYRSFGEARSFVRTLGLQSYTEWRAWA